MDSAPTAPHVSIIIPCFNESRTIAGLLDAIRAQTYLSENYEVIIADGGSRDSTREIVAAYQVEHSQMTIKLIDNPKQIIPAALNTALQAAEGEIIVRLDAHSAPAPDYVARCVAALKDGLGVNVGGVWDIQAGTDRAIARAIAAAAAHPLGVGDAQYRHATHAQEVDTVPFGAFHQSLIDEIGPFDESLLTNEDYEFNVRIRQQGGRIWLDPEIRSTYFARSTLKALFDQYRRYGYWKARMIQRYPETLRWRQFLPPVFVLGVLLLSGAGLVWPWARGLLALGLMVYLAILVLAGLQRAVQQRDLALAPGLPAAIATMHFAWGGAFLFSLIKLTVDRTVPTR
jgi:glycosyltransferase involved in cell wall biosynthesis